ncbi:MAG: dephospho-CoA kinase [Candidatus Dormibacteraeota bacterium]|nr:dephospho-CoA kinase [Candidatus Dormibacteraeota bacterium]
MKVLGLTGGIASGKSTVASMFSELGAEVIDADDLARQIVEPGQPALAEIQDAFGPALIESDGRLDRKLLADIVFADPGARARLNAVTHPRIRERMNAQVEARRMKPGVLILDIPLLYENALTESVEKTIVVWVDEATQLARLRSRDGLEMGAARARMAAQLPLAEKKALADYVIDNSGTREQTRRQVETLFALLAPP